MGVAVNVRISVSASSACNSGEGTSAVITINGIGYKVIMSINSLEKLPHEKLHNVDKLS